ncbi:MAG: glycosyltransferase family 2 protein [Paludibacteraceae bacterium]|nr:glycosyltransferase family 2 protein [Paludibacteraceae bacterium]
MSIKKIAVITMARNDENFLNKWVSYDGKDFGEENLYIFLDGTDQQVPAKAGKSNVTKVPKIGGQVVKAEKGRLLFLSERAAELLERGYDVVVGCDADEFLVVDPKAGVSLAQYLSSLTFSCCKSALGIDVGQHLEQEAVIDWEKPFLQQRKYAYVCSRYTKPIIVNKPCRWGAGFHRVKGHNFSIDPNLYLFHFGSFDMQMIESRYNDKDRMGAGWGKHIGRRAKTIYMVSKAKAKVSEKYVLLARLVQTCLRPIYALNKPSMAGWKLIIEIPKRFSNIL